jgi:glycosyltransferase involved in cell wall biosynthesis
MKISVIIPTYNRRFQIGPAIDSVFEQNWDDLELIVVDDRSTDDTVAWLGAKYTDPRLRVLPNVRKKGPAGARNTGLLAATGDLVAFLDSDDRFLPGHLTEAAEIFTRFPQVGLVFGRAIYEQNGQPVEYMGPNFDRKLARAYTSHVDEQVRVFDGSCFTHMLEFGCYFNLSTVVMRSEPAKALMNEDLRGPEDYEFWCRMSRTLCFACLERPQIRYLLHDENISFENAASAADNAPALIKTYEVLLGYENLTARQEQLIRNHLASVYFDWGYRCRLHGLFREAFERHRDSWRYGKRLANALAVAKLAVAASLPHRAP